MACPSLSVVFAIFGRFRDCFNLMAFSIHWVVPVVVLGRTVSFRALLGHVGAIVLWFRACLVSFHPVFWIILSSFWFFYGIFVMFLPLRGLSPLHGSFSVSLLFLCVALWGSVATGPPPLSMYHLAPLK